MIDPGPRRILVADDEPINRRLIEAILAGEGHEIVHAEDGVAALELATNAYVDLVLLDVMMPGLDGIEVCRRIRETASTQYLPVVLVTALTDHESRAQAVAAGADDFITKPVHEDELIARVRNLSALVHYREMVELSRRAAEKEATLWKLVSGVSDAIGASRDFASLHVAIATALAADLPFESSTVALIDGDRLSFHTTDRDGQAAPAVGAVRWDAELWQARLRTFGAERIDRGDPAAAPFGPWLAERGYGDGVLIPVVSAGRMQALFLLARYFPFDDADLTLVRMLAPHLAHAVDNVRLHLRSEQLLRAREELSRLLVHDLKNPLSVVRVNVEAAATLPLSDDDRAQALTDAARAADRVFAMLTDLLDVGAAEEGRLELVRGATPLRELVAEVAATLAPTARARGAEIVVVDGPEVAASVDRKLMQRVLENLVGNAARFVPRRGRIDVAVVAGADGPVIRVHNDGPAIPEPVRAALFAKYAGTRDDRGSARGLGLYFCRLVVEQHGGTIAALPVDAGATFEIALPALEPAVAPAAALTAGAA